MLSFVEAAQLRAVPSACPNAAPVAMRRVADRLKQRLFYVDCDSWNCPHCREKKREKLRIHAMKRCDVYKTVYILDDVDDVDLDKMQRRIKRRGGRYFTLKTGHETSTLFSNVDFDAGTERLVADNARLVVSELCKKRLVFVQKAVIRNEVIIQTFAGKTITRPRRVGSRTLNIFTSCREDSLKRDKPDSTWERSPLSVSRQLPKETIQAVLQDLGLKPRWLGSKGLYFWLPRGTTEQEAETILREAQNRLTSAPISSPLRMPRQDSYTPDEPWDGLLAKTG